VVANYAIPGSEEKWRASMADAGFDDTSCALAFGDDPKRTRLAGLGQAARFAVGGVQFAVCRYARARQGSSAFAAASAAFSTGEAAKMNSNATAPDRTMMAREPMPVRPSKASAGSSKNITFTTFR